MLQKRYDSGKFEFLPVYGRRRVGKTTLLREFMKTHNGVFFTATGDSLKNNIDNLASKLFGAKVSATLDTVFEEIERRSSERFVLIIDEYPRLLRHKSGFGDYLQEFIDSIHDSSKLFLILCGSSLSIMEHEVLGYKSPLYGRRTGSLKLNPMDVKDSMLLLDGFSRDDALKIYGMVGGVPMYLNMFNSALTLAENVSDLFLREDSFFRNEHTLLLIEEFENPATFYSVLTAVSSGKNTVRDVAQYSGLDAPTVTKHLATLISIGIVGKNRPVDNPQGKSTRYMITDNFMKFQFGRILPVIDDVVPDTEEETAENILFLFDTDIGFVFEEICSEHLRNIHGGSSGTWWGSDPVSKTSEEIDVVVTKSEGRFRHGWFAECKYRSSPVGKDVLDTLKKRVDLVKGYDYVHYVLYSKSGFTEDILDIENTELYALDDILGKE